MTDCQTRRKIHTTRAFGYEFVTNETEESMADFLAGHPPQSCADMVIVTPNVDILVQADESPGKIGALLDEAGMLLPDGWPLVAVSKLAGTGLTERLAGSGVFSVLWPRLAAANTPVTVVAAHDAIAQGLEFENPSCVTFVPPMITTSDDDIAAVARQAVELAVASGSAFIFVGIGFPKDGLIGHEIRRQWPAAQQPPHVCCFGASAEMYLGIRKRAPRWVRRWGLEWFYRFCQEPSRMFRRYFVRDVAFLPLALTELKHGRRTATRSEQ